MRHLVDIYKATDVPLWRDVDPRQSPHFGNLVTTEGRSAMPAYYWQWVGINVAVVWLAGALLDMVYGTEIECDGNGCTGRW